VLATLIVKSPKDLNKSFKILDEMKKKRSRTKDSDVEVKFSNSYPDERIRVLQSLSGSSVSIVYVVIDKKKSKCTATRATVICTRLPSRRYFH
jgi:hypothetical protein